MVDFHGQEGNCGTLLVVGLEGLKPNKIFFSDLDSDPTFQKISDPDPDSDPDPISDPTLFISKEAKPKF